MQNTRPTQAVIDAKKAEIARRYRRKRAKASRAQLSAIRIKELNRLFTARYGEILPNNEAGRQAIEIIAHHLVCLPGLPQKRLHDWATLHAPWMTVADVQTILAKVVTQPRTWKADSLAWLLKLNYADRQALKITTIGAIDCNASQRAAKRRQKAKKRAKLSRDKQKEKLACAP